MNYCRCPVGLGNDFRLSTATGRARDQSNGLALTAGLEFRARAGSPDDQPGDWDAAWYLAGLLAGRGDLDELRARADSGDTGAVLALPWLLAERGDLDALHARVRAGDWVASQLLPDLLAEQGRYGEADRLRRFGLNPDGSISRG